METFCGVKLLTSFGCLSNILPYYSTLDKVHYLYTNLHPLTRSALSTYSHEIYGSLFKDQKDQLDFIFQTETFGHKTKNLLSVLKKHKILLKIFKLPDITLKSQKEIEILFEICSEVGLEYVKFSKINYQNEELKKFAIDLFRDIQNFHTWSPSQDIIKSEMFPKEALIVHSPFSIMK